MTTSRLLLVGHGRMGQLVASLAPEFGFTVAGAIDEHSDPDAAWPAADVAIDFSIAEAVPATVATLAKRGTPVVIGTTGWQAKEVQVRESAAGIGVVAAPNFAVGVNVFLAVAARLGQLMAAQPSFGAWIHELHHAAKKDAPSGTALAIKQGMVHAGYPRPIDVSSTRVGSVPGTHTVGFDGPSETLEFTHTVRDRAVFARGALVAAQWLMGRRGWFSIRDLLKADS